MMRVIRYWDHIGGSKNKKELNPGATFSYCSTRMEVLPILVADDTQGKELLTIAKKLRIKVEGKVFTPSSQESRDDIRVMNAIRIKKPIVKTTFAGKKEYYQEYLGFVRLKYSHEHGTLSFTTKTNQPIPGKLANEIIGNQEYGINDVGPTVDAKTVLVKEGWHYYHVLPILGYSLEKFEKSQKISDHGFYDDTERCGDCGLFDSQNDGYTYNFRAVDGDYLGINCGCYAVRMSSSESLKEYVNNASNAIELEPAEDFQERGILKHVERFIGGMTDGRGGYYAGEPTREGKPSKILEELLKKHPKRKYVFSRDESGQFQTYFSIWQVMKKL